MRTSPDFKSFIAFSIASFLEGISKTLLYSPREGISLGLKVIMTSSQVNRDFFDEKAVYLHSEENLVQEIINAIE